MDCEIVKFRSQYSVLAYLFSGMHVGDPDVRHQTIPRSSEQRRNWQDRGRRETAAATKLSAAGVVQPDVCMLVLRLIDSPVGQRSQNATVVRNLLLLMSIHFVSVLWHCWLSGRKGIRPVKNGGWWMWALLSPDGVAPSQMVGVSASVNLPLHHKVQKFSSGTRSPGWSRKKGRKTVVVWWCRFVSLLSSGAVVAQWLDDGLECLINCNERPIFCAPHFYLFKCNLLFSRSWSVPCYSWL